MFVYLPPTQGPLRWLGQLFDGWGPAQAATVVAALLAIIGVTATILTTSARSRREHTADLYAEALHGVSDYLEGPYRIGRKDGTPAHRNVITAGLSDVKSAINHSQMLLRLHRPAGVAGAYDLYVKAAAEEAGQQMHAAWRMPAITTDAEVNLTVPHDRALSGPFRDHVVAVMQADLGRRWYKPWVAVHYWRLGPKAPQLPTSAPAVESDETELP